MLATATASRLLGALHAIRDYVTSYSAPSSAGGRHRLSISDYATAKALAEELGLTKESSRYDGVIAVVIWKDDRWELSCYAVGDVDREGDDR